MYNILIFIFGACWGSFLNVVAVRGLQGISFFGRSHCPSCNRTLQWWEIIPIISWIIIRGRCTTCHQHVSLWYPVIEYISALWIWSLVYSFPLHFLPALFLLSSALIVTIRTDGEHFLILRWCTIGIIPFGMAAAYFGLLPITINQSIVGCVFGAAYLALARTMFVWWKNYEGLGEGDIELIAAIGSFLGPMGMITTLVIASCLGTAYGVSCLMISSKSDLQTPIPFGLFLALGSWGTLLLKYF